MAVAEFLVVGGALPNGVANCLSYIDAGTGFGGLTDFARQEAVFRSLDDLHNLVVSDGLVPVRLEFAGIPGLAPDTATELVLERTAQPSQHHPLALVVDDEDIWGLPGDAPGPLDGGVRLVDLMVNLSESLPLSFAAVFNERPMCAPADWSLQDAFALTDFYVAEEFVGLAVLDRILSKAAGAGRRLENGVLVVSSERLGGKSLDVSESATCLLRTLASHSQS